jgi:purine-binding chemotaxis protein CheW
MPRHGAVAERDRVGSSSIEDKPGKRATIAKAVQALVFTAGARACAIPVEHVLETMRALPVVPVAGVPAFIRGLSVIRGAAIPVVDVDALLSSGMVAGERERFVTLKLGDRSAALAVDTVVGIRSLDLEAMAPLPELLRESDNAGIDKLGASDARLLVVLHAARLVPEDVWLAIGRVAGAT